MYNKNHCQIIALLSCVLLLVACKKFVTVGPPVSKLVTKSVFSDDATATAALLGIYAQMTPEGYYMSKNTGLLSDELQNYSSDPINFQLYTNSMDPISNLGPWQTGYNYIYQANAVLEGLENNISLRATTIRQLTGEAKFIRAFWYFYLKNLYGAVPLLNTTNYRVNSQASRNSISEVSAQVTKDLSDAYSTLSSVFVDGSDTAVSVDRVRPTKWAASAMLARAYLFDKKYDSAETYASNVIGNGALFSLETDLNKVFLKNSSEAILQLAIPLPNGFNNTTEGSAYILLSDPGDVAISSMLLNSFEATDKRRSSWIGLFVDNRDTFYFPFKYKVQNSQDVAEYEMVLRLAEVYLIRAEARVQLGDFNGAIEDMNVLRQRAGLPDYAGGADKSSLLSALLHERQVELFTEWGHRWFDLIRTGAIDTILGTPGDVCKMKGGSWNADGHQKLFPIWQSEINIDHNLTQNSGY